MIIAYIIYDAMREGEREGERGERDRGRDNKLKQEYMLCSNIILHDIYIERD